jgi:hypothetical protein
VGAGAANVADEADDSALLLLALAPEPSGPGTCNKIESSEAVFLVVCDPSMN